MFSRGLAFCLVLGITSVAHAGAVVTLVPVQSGPYNADQIVDVNVMLEQSPAGTARELRHVQLDFAASDADTGELTLIPPITHDLSTDIRFWDFHGGGTGAAEPNCATSNTSTCGAGHFFDSQFTSPPDRAKVVSMTYYFANSANLKAEPNAQRTLPASGQIRIGRMQVRLPNDPTPACYTLNALNAAQTNPDLGGADIRFGFGTDVSPDGVALTTWRANLAAPNNITGNSIEMCITGGAATLVDTTPNCDAVLTHATNNVFRLHFDGAVAIPTSGQLEIRPIMDGGAFGANISSNFTFSLESGNTVLRARENADNLTNNIWYAVTSNNWPGVNTFKFTFVHMPGNANQDNFTDFSDLSAIFANQNPPGGPADDSLYNINSDGFVDFSDLSAAFSFNGGTKPVKPTGHSCTVP